MRRFLPLCALLLPLALSSSADAQRTACEGGVVEPAGQIVSYACNGVDMMGQVNLPTMNAIGANDIWGWTDPEDGSEYAVVGLHGGTAFVDVTDAENPVYLGKLPTHTTSTLWRDVKVHANHAYIVSEAGGHGIQVFDLTQLRDVASPPVTFAETAHYDGIGSAHNIVINEESGFAYAVGSQSGTESRCAGGLHMVDLSSPAEPTFAGCFSSAGYTHDAQCVIYDGPDTEYTGREICFASNGRGSNDNSDSYVIVDVTDKANPVELSETIYPNPGYAHQGWLTEDMRFFIAGDEGDESNFGVNTRTMVFDVSDLDTPEFKDEFFHDTEAIDHNLYIKGPYVYQSNYQAGLRILDASELLSGASGAGLEEVAFFDTFPGNDNAGFRGTWSNYPYFDSGNIIVSDGSRGLFILRAETLGTLDSEDAAPGTFLLSAGYPNPFADRTRLDLRSGTAQAVRAEVFDVLGRRVAVLFDGVVGAGEARALSFDGAGLPAGTYLVRVTGEDFAETRHVTLAR